MTEVNDMAKMSKGTRAGTRYTLQRKPRERGLTKITKSLQTFEEGERAVVKIDPSIHKGMPNKRFHGLTGVVVGKQGNCYVVEVKDGDKPKTVIARPEHLKKTA
jgi:large subunit ribosomal protein L21e